MDPALSGSVFSGIHTWAKPSITTSAATVSAIVCLAHHNEKNSVLLVRLLLLCSVVALNAPYGRTADTFNLDFAAYVKRGMCSVLIQGRRLAARLLIWNAEEGFGCVSEGDKGIFLQPKC